MGDDAEDIAGPFEVSTDEKRDEIVCSFRPSLPAVICCGDEEEYCEYRCCCNRGVILVERELIIIASGNDRKRRSHDRE